MHFRPGGGLTFDFIDHEMRSKGGGFETAGQLLQDITDFTSQTRAGSSHDPFFPLMAARCMKMALVAIWRAYKRCSVADIYWFCTSLPTTSEQALEEKWREESYAMQTLIAARNQGEDDDLTMAADFVLVEWPRMGDRTQGGIHAQVMTVLSRFMGGDVRGLIASGRTNCSPEDWLDGKIIVVDLPALVYREPGMLSQLIWKLSAIRSALRREITAESIPICIWADEAQLHAIPKVDSMTQAVARSHKLINVAITQSDNLLVSVMRSKEDAFSWSSNLMSKLIFASNDLETMIRCSKLAGQSKQLIIHGTGGQQKPYDLIGDWLGEPQGGGVSFSEQWQPNIRPEEFGLLRKGGAENGFIVDFFFTQAGRKFSNNRTFIRCSLQQQF